MLKHLISGLIAATLTLGQALPSADLSVLEGASDLSTSDYLLDGSAGTLELRQTSHRWIWPVQVSIPGNYNVFARVGVAASHAGASLRVGSWIPQFGEAGAAETPLTETDPASDTNPQWQSLGSIHLTTVGRQNLFARFTSIPTATPGLLHSIRLVGPGEIESLPTWEARTSACDPGTTGAGSLLLARYTEVIPSPLPLPAIGGTFTTCQAPGGYLGCKESFFWSSWESGGIFPDILFARGGTREYDHEGSGRTISLEALSLPLDVRRMSLVMSKPDGNGDLVSTVLVGEAGQAWQLLGRMKRPNAGTKVSSTLGFLENPGTFNAHLMRRSSGWANPWFFGEKTNGAVRSWSQPDQLKAHLRGPSPVDAPPFPKGTYPWGSTRLRQDLMEMTIGGQLQIISNDTFYPTPVATQPEMPSLNLAYDLESSDYPHLAPDATVGSGYTASLADLVNDPFSILSFEFAPQSLPSWLSLDPSGTIHGTPTPSDAGKSVLTFSATDNEAGLSGSFTAVVVVKAAGNTPPIFLDESISLQVAATNDDSDIFSPRTYDPDPEDTPSLTILSGNDGTFAIDTARGMLVKATDPAPDTSWNLILEISDDSPSQDNDTLAVTINSGESGLTGGAFQERWFTLAGSSISDLTSNPAYPEDPAQESLVGDLEDPATGKNTGSRIRGWIHPPTTGDYTFWISGDDSAELWLADDESPTTLSKRCEANNSSRFRDYDKDPTQESTAITLSAGDRYYFEVLSKRAGGVGGTPGSFSVAWEGPGFSRKTVEAQNLSPWKHLPPCFFKDDIRLAPGLTGAAYSGFLHPKLSSLPLHPSITYSKVSGPAWLVVAPDGELSGSPEESDSGPNSFTLQASTPGGLIDTASFQIEVETNQAPVWQGILSVPPVDEGSRLEFDIHSDATDPNVGTRFGVGDQLRYSLSNAPSWIFITTNGVIHGTPSASDIGAHSFDLVVTDTAGLTANRTITVAVSDINTSPHFVADLLKFRTAPLLQFSHHLTSDVYEADGGETLTFNSSNLPSWLDLSPEGLLSGNSEVAHIGRHSFDIEVSDSTNLTDTVAVQVDVSNPDPVTYEGFEGDSGGSVDGFGSGTGWESTSNWSRISGTSSASTLGAMNSFPGIETLGHSCTLAGGEDLERLLNHRHTLGYDPGETEELWITFSLDNPGSIASGHAYELALVDDTTEQLSFGKPINGKWSLESPSDSVAFTSNNSSSNSGNWLAAIRLVFDGTDTQASAWLAQEGDPNIDPFDPSTYPRTGTLSLQGSVSFDRLRLLSHNTTSARIDEISLGNSLARALTHAADTDLDNTPNHLDDDDDNDLIPDTWEALYGMNPLIADAQLAPQASTDDHRVDFGMLSVNSPAKALTATISNLGQGPADLTFASITLEGSPNFSISSVPTSIPADSDAVIEISITPGSDIGRQSAVLVVTSNDLLNPPLSIPVEALITPEGTPLSRFDFEPDEVDAEQLDLSDELQVEWLVSPLTDEATGNGALSSGNQTATNRTLATDGRSGGYIAFSANRESDAETPLLAGGNNESTWSTFTITPQAGQTADFSTGTALLESYSGSSLAGEVSADWTLYYSTASNLTWQSLGTQSGANSVTHGGGPTLLTWDLAPIGSQTAPVAFLLDPQSTGATNGSVGQRWIGFDNLTVMGSIEDTAGSFETWAAAAGIPALETGDSDQDRLVELIEYALGLDPNAPSRNPGRLSGRVLEFTKGSDAVTNGDLSYVIETSSDLGQSDPWTPIVPDIDDDSKISYTLPAGVGRVFGRLNVRRITP